MKYEFGGKVYVQEKLVWGQVRALASVLKGLSFEASMNVPSIIETFGEKISQALAIVLTEEGHSIKGKDLVAQAEILDATIPIDVVIQVIEDFFVCNPTALILEKLAGAIGNFQNQIVAPETTETTSTK